MLTKGLWKLIYIVFECESVRNNMTELDEVNKILDDAHALYGKGMSFLNEGNKLLHDGIYKYPKNTSLRLALASFMGSSGNFHDAIELYQTVLQNQPNDPYALTGLGRIYFEMGKFPESFKLAQASLNVRDMPETRILLCKHYLSQGNFVEVEKILEEILSKDPNNPDANLMKQRLAHIKARDDQPEDFR